MCGRFALDSTTNNLIELFVAEGNDFEDWIPRYSIAPTNVIPIIRERVDSQTGQVSRRIERATWDFQPAPRTGSRRPQINARVETVSTNGFWKRSFSSSRCLIPMRGYFEWSAEIEDGKEIKQPHFIQGDSPILAAAGIYVSRPVDGGWSLSTAIITREARDASGEVHDRMPVFLTPDVYAQWLDPGKLSSEAEGTSVLAMALEVSAAVAATVTTFDVDRRLNNTRAIDPLDSGLISRRRDAE